MPPPDTVLITGATGAIGRALALAYAAPGRTLVLQGRDEARLAQVVSQCEAAGAAVRGKRLDLLDLPALTAWLEGLAAERLPDLVIVNAGVINVLPPGIHAESPRDAARVLDVNVRAAVATAGTLAPHMQRRGSGQIALVSSLLAWFGLPQAPSYCASKAALKAWGEALREPLARDGVRVNVVLPGFVKSEMSDALRLPKLFMLSPEDAARRIVHGLARDQARISFPLPLAAGSWLLSALPPALARALLALLGFNR